MKHQTRQYAVMSVYKEIILDAGLPYVLLVTKAKSVKDAKRQIQAWPYFIKYGKASNGRTTKGGVTTSKTVICI